MATRANDGQFNFGRVFGMAVGAITSNALLYIGLALVLFGIPLAVFGAIVGPGVATGVMTGTGSPFASISLALLFVVATVAASSMLQAALIRATVEHLNDRKPNIGDCLQTAIRAFLPILGVGLLSGLGIALGAMLLVVPGLILMVMWSIATPALIEERLGITESLGRSRALTSGSRWSIFGLLIVAGIVGYVFQLVFGLVAVALGPVIGLGASVLGSSLSSLLSTTVVASTYVELRMVKEGATASSLAEIFA